MAVTPDLRSPAPPLLTSTGDSVFLEPGCSCAEFGGRIFRSPREIVAARTIDEVLSALATVELETARGNYATGFIAYEAGAAFEKALPRRPLAGLPYLWFAIYDAPPEGFRANRSHDAVLLPFRPGITQKHYTHSLDRIREWIAAGDTYQVNFTFPLSASFDAEAETLFFQCAAAQNEAAHRSFINLGTHAVASLSPELFFQLDGDRIIMRPMKGTAPRHSDPVEDLQRAERLRQSAKERAENLMIVDLIRNDLGRIAETGSVQVDRLFEVERYQTLWTMTSTISARTCAAVPDIFAALFPSGSVTGAPKIRTMQIIGELESEPRGPYCGAIGWWGPNRQAEFSVGIRTLVVDRENRTATYRVGSGVTWDSKPEAEYDECLLKAAVLTRAAPEFDLLESLRLENGVFWLLERHVDRLRTSAAYFGYPFDEPRLRQMMGSVADAHPVGTYKVRVLLSNTGDCTYTAEAPAGPAIWRIALANRPIDSQSPFVYNKTTHREAYDAAIAGRPDIDDVILFNRAGELTETARANLVLDIDDELLTPPRTAGLLPGTFREELLAMGQIREHRLIPADLERAGRIRLINSVRGWIDVERVDS